MRYYLICFTNEENDSEKLRNFPTFVKAGSGGPPPPVPTPNIIWSHVDPVPPFSPSVPISCMLSFDSALSLDSRICSSNHFLANLTFLDPHAFHNPQPAQHSPQVPPCPLWSYTGITDGGLDEDPHLCWLLSPPICHLAWQSHQVCLVHRSFIYSRPLWSQVSSFLNSTLASSSSLSVEDFASYFTEEVVTVWRWIYPFLWQSLPTYLHLNLRDSAFLLFMYLLIRIVHTPTKSIASTCTLVFIAFLF